MMSLQYIEQDTIHSLYPRPSKRLNFQARDPVHVIIKYSRATIRKAQALQRRGFALLNRAAYRPAARR